MLFLVATSFWQKVMLSKQISINDGLFKITLEKYDKNLTLWLYNSNDCTLLIIKILQIICMICII